MIQSLFIIAPTGDVIIEKHWRGLVQRTVCDTFWEYVRKASDPAEVLPVISTTKHYFIHVQRDGMFFLSIVQQEVSPLLVIEFLHRVVDIFIEYFHQVDESTIKNNFVTVYQLLDEMMDNGMPFSTEGNVLKAMINAPNIKTRVVGAVTGKSQVNSALPDGSLSNIPWRRVGVKHTTNEVYFDIIEELDAIVDPNGLMVSSEVHGNVAVNCKLSGMPDLTLSFQNPHILDDVSLHPCVRYNRWEHDKLLSFVPPDGEFKLLSYRVKGDLQLPLYVKPQFSWSGTTGRVSIMTGPKNTQGKAIEGVKITIPFSKSVSSVRLESTFGSVQFDETTKVCVWQVGKMPKDKSPMLTGDVILLAGASAPDQNPILSVDFRIVMFSCSGIKVESLALHREKYKPYKGVRTITKAGNLQIRS